jgi:TIR domain
MATIFLNHLHDEPERPRRIADALTKRGHRVHMQATRWREDLIPLLSQTDLFVVLLTQRSIWHEFTRLEWGIGYAVSLLRTRPAIMSVRLQDVTYPTPLEDLGHRVDAFTQGLDDDQIAQLISDTTSDWPIGPKIFISHDHGDQHLAETLVDLIKKEFEVKDGGIRVTSLKGYELPLGAEIPGTLRREINSAEFVLGIMTPRSVKSQYVLFEIGAAWGINKSIGLLLADGASREDLPGPLKDTVYAESLADLIHQLKRNKILPVKKPFESSSEPGGR